MIPTIERTEEFCVDVVQLSDKVFSVEIVQTDQQQFTVEVNTVLVVTSVTTPEKPLEKLNIGEDGLLLQVPAGNKYASIFVLNEIAEITFNLGTTPGGNDILDAATFNANTSTDQTINFSSGIGLPAFDVYISSLEWNTSLDIYSELKLIK